MHTETELKFSIKKRTYYGKPPLTDDEVNEKVKRKTKFVKKMLEEALDVLTGKKKFPDCSQEFQGLARAHYRGESDGYLLSRSDTKSKSKGRGNLLRG